jgi:two-component sensor histidine kinase
MRIITFFNCLFLFCIPSVLDAQDNRDSLLRVLLKTAEPPPKDWVDKTALWDKIADAYSEVNKLDSAALFLEQVRGEFERIGDKKRQATNLNRLGLNANRLLQFDKAMQYNFKALALWEALDDKVGIAKSYCNLSLDFFQNENGKATSLNENFKPAADYGEKAIVAALKTGDSTLIAEAYQRASSGYLGMGKFDKALEIINKSIAIKEKRYPESGVLASAFNDKGNVLKYLKRYDEALAAYRTSLNICEKIDLKRGISATQTSIANILVLQKQPAQALPHLLKAIEIAEAINFRTNAVESYGKISEVYEELGNYKEALKYFQKSKTEQDSFYSIEREKNAAELQTRYETGKKEALLTVQEQEIKQQRLRQWLILGVVVLLAGLLFALYRNYLARTKSNTQLAEANKKLGAKNAENELLLKEIHHRVKNNLEVISSLLELQSAQISDPSVQNAMLASQNRVQSMGILHQKLYQSEHLAFIEMKNYFMNLSENILDSYNASERVTVELPMNELELDVDTAVPIGLIVNELLTNSLKYAFEKNGLGKVSLSLIEKENNYLELIISDNGIGKDLDLNAKAQGTGFGTQLVALLTKQLDGTIRQEVKNGTVISIAFKRAKAA